MFACIDQVLLLINVCPYRPSAFVSYYNVCLYRPSTFVPYSIERTFIKCVRAWPPGALSKVWSLHFFFVISERLSNSCLGCLFTDIFLSCNSFPCLQISVQPWGHLMLYSTTRGNLRSTLHLASLVRCEIGCKAYTGMIQKDTHITIRKKFSKFTLSVQIKTVILIVVWKDRKLTEWKQLFLTCF